MKDFKSSKAKKRGSGSRFAHAVNLKLADGQLRLPFGPIVNRELLSNHWLDHRLALEPEWDELCDDARTAASKLIELWNREGKRVAHYGDEAGLEEKFIQPVLEILGWKLKYQTFLQGREPDYALFTTEERFDTAIMGGRTNPDFWLSANVVADAKAWHVSLDRPIRENGKREYPPEQIEWYLDRSRCDFGILTNGRLWRLVPRDIDRARPRFGTYLEVDLPALIESIAQPLAQLPFLVHGPELDLFLRFYLFFSAHGFEPRAGRQPLIKRAVEGSSEHALGVSEELKERVFEALRLSIEGFLNFSPNKLLAVRDIEECQKQSLVFLYRLLFVLFAEDRGFLPYQLNETYTKNRSLARFRSEVAVKLDLIDRGLDKVGYSTTSTTLWAELKALWDIVDVGNSRYGVPPYNGGLFSSSEHKFLENNALPDNYVARIIDQLSRATDREHADIGLFRVDYRDLAIQQLGSVYEGLLELHPQYANTEMIVIRSKATGQNAERIVEKSSDIPKDFETTGIRYRPGQVYLTTDKGERRLFGSYYTPDQIVNHMVGEALGPICKKILENIESELSSLAKIAEEGSETQRRATAVKQNEIAGAFGKRILELKVLDPAMGSGHFLIRACQYLAEEIATNPYTAELPGNDGRDDEASLVYWKRRVAEMCLYGVDVNSMAVELAKLALWLETVAIDAPLAFLDHHFQHGDSLIGARLGRLDAFPGEPLVSGLFSREIAAAKPQLLEPIQAIGNLSSSNLENVKKKEQLFWKRYRGARRRFELIGDSWCASVLEINEQINGPASYAALLHAVLNGRRGEEEPAEALEAEKALADSKISCFHWELAFPDVFLTGICPGFDVILGNPPYDVLAEKESGPRIAHLKKFINADDTLTPSSVGKNNLYKLFICRALEILRPGGYLTFIVPMPLLGDEQASGIREALLKAGQFKRMDAFPQKDNVSRRVFRDAKLSTAIFVFKKKSEGDTQDVGFPSFRHGANTIDAASPSLLIKTEDIAQYDPANLTIVSCSQADWDLALRLSTNPGFKRLGNLCKSFQGEVNETTDKKYLTDKSAAGNKLVLRGANICMYSVRDASQGEPLYLDVNAFQQGKGKSAKAFHSRLARIGFQRSAPQNNYRRVIAAYIPAGEFCFDTVSYVPLGPQTLIDIDLLLAVLNSKLIDWYFSIGSTNSKVNEYQFNILPCPVFKRYETYEKNVDRLINVLKKDPAQLPDAISNMVETRPFNSALETVLIELARSIRMIEDGRGAVSKADRAHLAGRAQDLQSVLDLILFKMAGYSRSESDLVLASLNAMS